MVLWDHSPPSSQSPGSMNKVTTLCLNKPSLNVLAFPVVSSMNLDLETKGLCGTCRLWPSVSLSIAATSAEDTVCQNQQRISSHPYWVSLSSSVGLLDSEQRVVWARLPAKHVSIPSVWCTTDFQGAWVLGEVTVTFSVNNMGHSCFSLAQDSSMPRPLSSNTTQLPDAWPRRMSNDPLLWIRGCLR